MRMYTSTSPWVLGKAPVPIVACAGGVFEGAAPPVASANQAPPSLSDARVGHASGHRCSTLSPTESQTTVTTSAGTGRSSSAARASTCACPSGASKGNFRSAAWVGAISASVTDLVYTPGLTYPGP